MNVHSLPEHDASPKFDSLSKSLDIRHLVFDDCASHPLKANGIHHVARMLAREQSHAGDEARIVFLRSPSRQDGLSDWAGQRTDVIPLKGYAVRDRFVHLSPDALSPLFAGVSERTFFHIHGVRQTLLLFLGREMRRRKIRYGITVHGRYSHLFDSQLRVARRVPALYARTIERPILERARFVQAVSAPEMAVIHRIAPNANVSLVPNAAYSSALDEGLAESRHLASSAEFPIFGFCGRYEIEHKGLDLLMNGFAQHKRSGGKGLLRLIGTGPAREQLTAMAATLGLQDSVDIGGPKFGSAKATALGGWHYFIQPSRFDGVPIGALEAALAGLPLIVTIETGLAEHTRSFEAGIAVPKLTAEAVANALLEAERIAPSAWDRMSHNATLMARSVGDWTAIAQQIKRLYERQ